MSDPLRKPTSGEPFVPSARQTGMFIDAAIFAQQQGQLTDKTKKTTGGPDYVLVRNSTEDDLTALHPILGLGDPVNTPEDRETVVFEQPVLIGEVPAAEHYGKFAVLVGPVKEDAMRLGVVSGVCWVQVYIESEGHGYADIDEGSTERLRSANTGSALILWKEVGDEETVRWALVRLSNATDMLIVEMQETVGPGKAGTARVQKITNDPDTLVTGDDITLADTDPVRDIVVVNFRPNRLADGVAYLAHRMGKFWVVENDACFQDFMS